MSLRRKTSRRLIFLGVVVVLGICGLGAMFLMRNAQRSRRADEQRAEGMRLVQERMYYQAMGPLSKYLKTKVDDREALLAYAKARRNVEDKEGKHFAETASVLQKAWSLDRSDRPTGLDLLEMFVSAGMNGEAISLATEMRPADLSKATKDDLVVLRFEASSRVRSGGKDVKTGDVLRRIIELDPDDHGSHVMYVEWLRDNGRQDQARELARAYARAHPGDARSKILDAIARSGEAGFNAGGELFQALCEVNGLDPLLAGRTAPVKYKDGLEVLRYASLFDAMGYHPHALSVLLEGGKQTDDEAVHRLMLRRAWMAGRSSDVLAYTKDANLAPNGTHTEVLAFRALALIEQGRPKEAEAIAKALENREGDFRASSWKIALPALLSDPPLPAEQLAAKLDEAAKKAPQEPILLVFRGDALERAGRTNEARDEWRKASRSPFAVGWARPWLNQASSYIAQGRPQSALAAAQQASRIAPRSMSAYLALFRANISLLMGGYEEQMSARPAQLLASSDRIDSEFALSSASDVADFRQRVLPGRVLLTSRVRGKEAARAMLDGALKDFSTLDVPIMQELLDISRREELGLEEQLAEKLGEPSRTSSQAAYAIAVWRGRTQGKNAGLEVLTRGAAESPQDQRLSWRVARANYLEAMDDEGGSRAEWAGIVKDYPNDLTAHLAALASNSVVGDRSLVEQILQRAMVLGEYDQARLPGALRIARARSLLAPPVSDTSRFQAVETLRALLSSEPDWIEARTLLIRALLWDDAQAGVRPMVNEAVEEVRALIPLVPDPAPLNLDLARLLLRRGDRSAAKAQLEAITSSERASVDVRLDAIDLLIAQRELDSVVGALERMRQNAGERSLDVRVRLASVYRALTRDREAQVMLRDLAREQFSNPDHVVAVATDLASLGDRAGAENLLRQLDAMTLEPGRRETILARYAARFGTPEQTVQLLRESVAQRPADPEAWADLIAYLNESVSREEADKALREARSTLGDHPRLKIIEQQLSIASGSGPMDLQAIARVLDQQPEMQKRARALRELAQLRDQGKLTDRNEVDRLSERYADEPVVQTVLAQLLVGASPPQINKAMEIVRRTLREHPRSVETATYATELFRQTQTWSEMLSAAKAWQQLTRDRMADVAVGEALLALDRRELAADAVKAHLEGARQNPNDAFSLHVLDLSARALVRGGRADQAFDLLSPLIEKSSQLRDAVWMPIIGQMLTSEASSKWIERVTPLLKTDSVDEQLALASVHANLARRFQANSRKHLDDALHVVRPLAARADAPAGVFEALGTIHLMRGELSDASREFRKTLDMNPRSVASLRSLSRIESRTNPREAVKLAERALAVAGPTDADSHDALAGALMMLAGTQTGDDAAASFARAGESYGQVVTLMPHNAQAMLGAIMAWDSAGQPAKAIPFYEKLGEEPTLPPGLSRAVFQNNFADTIVRAGLKGDQLQRARSMAMDATRAESQAAFFDTLGSVERALNKRDAAIAAYRRAVELDPAMHSSAIALIELLAEGNEQDKDAAQDALDRLERQTGVPADVKDRATALRKKLRG